MWVKMEAALGLDQADKDLVERALASMATVEVIAKKAVENFDPENNRSLLKEKYGEAVYNLEAIASKIYFQEEGKTFGELVNKWVEQNKEVLLSGDLEKIKNAIKKIGCIAREFEFRAGQMRKARAGRTFEYIIKETLNCLGVSCEKPQNEGRRILKRIDLVVPNQEVALERPDQAFFLSCKRTLRERWKQTIPERKPCWRVFLLTLDNALSEEKANEAEKLGIIIYVKDELKSKDHLKDKSWVRKLSELPKDLGAK